jgi:hypothetical protein
VKIQYGGEVGGNSRSEMWGKAIPKALADNILITEEHACQIGKETLSSSIPFSGLRLCWWGKGNSSMTDGKVVSNGRSLTDIIDETHDWEVAFWLLF